jgi:sulfite exporter TauE/SafE
MPANCGDQRRNRFIRAFAIPSSSATGEATAFSQVLDHDRSCIVFPAQRGCFRRCICFRSGRLCVLGGRWRHPAACFPAFRGGAFDDGVQCRGASRQPLGTAQEHTGKGSLVLIVGGLVGTPIAVYLLHNADTRTFRIGFGLLVALYAGYTLFRPTLTYLRQMESRGRNILVGFGGGLIGGLTAMPGALPTIWCDMHGMSKPSSAVSFNRSSRPCRFSHSP